jgi:hypothetical protein
MVSLRKITTTNGGVGMITTTTKIDCCPDHDCPLVLVFMPSGVELVCLECAAVLEPDDELDLRDADEGGK